MTLTATLAGLALAAILLAVLGEVRLRTIRDLANLGRLEVLQASQRHQVAATDVWAALEAEPHRSADEVAREVAELDLLRRAFDVGAAQVRLERDYPELRDRGL